MNCDYDKLLKCIFIGDPYIGKSSLCNKLVGFEFPLSYQSTIGVDFFIKLININNEIIKLQIWDTTGQEKYKSITNSFYRKINIVFLMFDLTNYKSFYNLNEWIRDANIFCPEESIKILIGNKTDLKSVVDKKDINELCEKNDLKYYSCSAKEDNMEQFIKNILIQNYNKNKFIHMDIDDNIIKLNKKRKINCCNIL